MKLGHLLRISWGVHCAKSRKHALARKRWVLSVPILSLPSCNHSCTIFSFWFFDSIIMQSFSQLQSALGSGGITDLNVNFCDCPPRQALVYHLLILFRFQSPSCHSSSYAGIAVTTLCKTTALDSVPRQGLYGTWQLFYFLTAINILSFKFYISQAMEKTKCLQSERQA